MNQPSGHFLITRPRSPGTNSGWYRLLRSALTAIFILMQQGAIAQENHDLLKTADEYYQKEQYHTAAQYYQVAAGMQPNNPGIIYRLAECYRAVFDYSMAANYYEKTMELDEGTYPLASFYLAQMQKSIGNFKHARDGFEHFIETNRERSTIPDQERSTLLKQAEIEMEGSIWAIEQLGKSWRDMGFRSMPEPVNSPYNDYAAITVDNAQTVTITSGRKGGRGALVDNRFGDYFTDNYRYRKQGDKWEKESISDHFDRTNTKFSDGVGTYNSEGDKYYFTSCYEGNAFCKLYVTYLENGVWKNPRLLNENVNAPGYDNKHPTLTPGGDTLIFVSNRPGGPGGNDLWFSVSRKGEDWETPRLLPGNINTPFNEASPFYHNDNLLFFSSDGHAGIGGMDIFMARGYNGAHSTIQNLGTPFNSGYDDSFFSLGPGIGFLSSNRPGGTGKFDIYAFNLPEQDENLEEYLQESAEGTHLRSRIRNNDGSNLYAVRDEDQFYYDNLSEEERRRLDRILSNRQNNPDHFDQSGLSKEDINYYKKLDIATRASIERLVVKRIEQAERQESGMEMTLQEKLDWEFYHNVPEQEREIIDRIIDIRIEARRRAVANLTDDQQHYINDLSNRDRIESKTQLQGLIQESENTRAQREALLARNQQADQQMALQQELQDLEVRQQQTTELQEQVSQYIDELEPAAEPHLEEQVVKAYFTQANLLLPLLTPKESQYLESLDPGHKLRIERLAGLVEVQTREYQIDSMQPDKNYLPELLASDQWFYQGLSVTEQELVDELVALGRTGSTFYSASQQEFIAGLSPGERERLDRMIRAHGTPSLLTDVIEVPNQSPSLPEDQPASTETPDKYSAFYGTSIYFDFNQYRLREEAKAALNDLVSFIDEQGQPVKIRVEGHADDVGSISHNYQLSEQRSKATAAFLEQSSDFIQVVTKSFGEKRPASNNKTQVGRQLNRRVELKIQGLAYQPSLYTFLVKPNTTAKMIGEATGLWECDILKWNGLTNGDLQPYQPLRLPADIDHNAVKHLLLPTPGLWTEKEKEGFHTVRPGENLFRLSLKYNTTVEVLQALNNLTASELKAGQQIKLP